MAEKAKKSRMGVVSTFYNPISFTGSYLAILSFGLILLLILIDWASGHQAPYIGILSYIILPVFLIGGLLLIPVGMWRQHRRQVLGKKVRRLPRLDMNIPRHRRSFIIFVTGTVILVFFTGIGSYRAYEFSNSVTFCGQACHSVMEPEFTAYQTSPHARVACVDCHVGEGAEWFVKSKLSGAYQVYSVLFHKYESPIPTPVENLRPARETCERCHWPQKFYGNKQTTRIHFMPDDENTRWEYSLLVKIGGTHTLRQDSEGIHWHIDNKIEYLATDEKRQDIPWLRVTYRDGTTRIFKTEDDATDGTPPVEQIRTMDCIDCHNRPSHIFRPPQIALNNAIDADRISLELPSIKSIAVEALEAAETDSTVEVALATISHKMRTFYQDDYPEVWEQQQETVEKSIAGVQNVFRQNYFPKMKTSWRSHANNIGHFVSPGCYRCHDGLHLSEDGEAISHDCNICHLIIEQTGGETVAQQNLNGLVFQHPEDIDEEWKETGCYECHGE